MKLKFLLITLITLLLSSITYAEKKIYTEDEFLTIFNGKPKARVVKYLGEPDKKEIAIEPKGASKTIGRPTDNKDNKKKDKVDMWYYSNIVKSGKDTTWKRIEFTFINDRCMNIAFSN
jgi:hypothetical protein